MRTRVKFCGITRPEDGMSAAEIGVDALGLVFYSASPRAVSVEQAQHVIKRLPPFIAVVGLFVNALEVEIEQVLHAVRIDVLQFHGDESAQECEKYALPYLKALRMREDLDVAAQLRTYAKASGILLDSYQTGLPGGTGKPFDWRKIPQQLDKPIILAGGLNPDNVAVAIETVRPYAVDVSGGIEADKGVKDPRKMKQFMTEVQRVGTD